MRLSRPSEQLSLVSGVSRKGYGRSRHPAFVCSRFSYKRAELDRRRSCRILASDNESSVAELPRDDDVLPDNLADSLFQASEATVMALNRGYTGCTVELLLPEFWDPLSGPVFSDEGDNLRFWKLTRRYLSNLEEQSPTKNIKALFPDIGVTMMLKNLWKDANFEIECLNSKSAVVGDNDMVVIAAPDPQGFEDCRRIIDEMSEDGSVILFNPRLSSGDVGVGLNVRRIRNMFMRQFVTVYSLRPIGDFGTVFRKFPEPWLVFIVDDAMPGRYKKIAERSSRPAGDVLDSILQEHVKQETKDGDEKSEPGFAESITLPIRSFQRFMRSLM